MTQQRRGRPCLSKSDLITKAKAKGLKTSGKSQENLRDSLRLSPCSNKYKSPSKLPSKSPSTKGSGRPK